MNAWRLEIKEWLEEAGAPRPPALRRSLREDFLYATDLPKLLPREELERFEQRAEAAGWTWREEGDWLELTRGGEAPPAGWYGGPFGGEAACCLSLLERQGGGKGTDDRAVLKLIKAGEEGPEACEKVWREIHLNWAERLREGKELPQMDPAWFGGKKSIS